MNIKKHLLLKLPEEIRQHIIGYSHSPQPKILLSDIEHFKYSLDIMCDWYSNTYILQLGYTNDEIEKQVFIYDLFEHFNYYIPLASLNYLEEFVKIWMRFPKIRKESEFENLFENFMDKNISSQLRIFWGILTVSERNSFIRGNSEVEIYYD